MPARATSSLLPTLVAALVPTLGLGACGGGGGSPDAFVRPTQFGGDRPATLNVPADFDPTKTYPLIVILHGYSATGLLQEAYFGLKAEVTAGNALEIAPDGLVDSLGNQYWNADPACCDLDHKNPDDSGYIGKLIDDIKLAYPVDQVYVVGHSNGGYMAYRMACDRSDVITAIGVLAGIVSTDPAVCHPAQHVGVLHMHGTADTTVPYTQTATYAGAIGSVTRWAGYDGCGTTLTPGGTLDLDSTIPGAETQISTASCGAPLGVELWSINGAGHIPTTTPGFEPALWSWLTTHHR